MPRSPTLSWYLFLYRERAGQIKNKVLRNKRDRIERNASQFIIICTTNKGMLSHRSGDNQERGTYRVDSASGTHTRPLEKWSISQEYFFSFRPDKINNLKCVFRTLYKGIETVIHKKWKWESGTYKGGSPVRTKQLLWTWCGDRRDVPRFYCWIFMT